MANSKKDNLERHKNNQVEGLISEKFSMKKKKNCLYGKT